MVNHTQQRHHNQHKRREKKNVHEEAVLPIVVMKRVQETVPIEVKNWVQEVATTEETDATNNESIAQEVVRIKARKQILTNEEAVPIEVKKHDLPIILSIEEEVQRSVSMTDLPGMRS